MEKSRIAALADGIFAVAMTLLVLDLKLPESAKTATDAEVWRQLVDLKGLFLIYALSFLVLGTYWVGHHHQFHFVRRVNRGLLWLNLLFLLFITLVPFSTNLLADRSHLHLPVVVYGLNLLLLSVMFLWHLRYLTRHPELAHDGLTPARAAEVRRRSALVVFVAAASIVVSFYKPSLALNAYWLLLAFHLLRARTDRYPAADGEATP
jgi:uncharacterized membrane protein